MPADDVVVFELITRGDSKCDECGSELAKGNLLRKEGERGLCIDCADFGHLVFAPAGDACITRRASKYSTLRAIVLRFSRSRKRYERQGILVEEDALARAEEECIEDADLRERRRASDAERRAARNEEYVRAFADEVRRRYPNAPADAAERIAGHACEMYSKRIGRTARAKDLDPGAVDLAVRAHIRHVHTNYDELMASGVERLEARARVHSDVDRTLAKWRGVV